MLATQFFSLGTKVFHYCNYLQSCSNTLSFFYFVLYHPAPSPTHPHPPPPPRSPLHTSKFNSKSSLEICSNYFFLVYPTENLKEKIFHKSEKLTKLLFEENLKQKFSKYLKISKYKTKSCKEI